jgi:hypothetical protein
MDDPSQETLNADGPFDLLFVPVERADIVIDFNNLHAGSSFILYRSAFAIIKKMS